MEIIKLDNINNDLFNIYNNETNIPPVCISIDNKYYQISGFSNTGDEYIFYGEYNISNGLNLAFSFINNISFKQVIKIYNICSFFKADLNSINVFKELNIKGDKSFLTLEKSLLLPLELIDYIDKKEIPLKTISLIVSQNSNIINFIKGYVIHNDVSMQNFRKFIEKVCDFKEIIPAEYTEFFQFPNVKSRSHMEVESKYYELIKSFNNIKVINSDNFESPKLNITCEISSVDDYMNIISSLESNKNNITSFYELLEKYGLK